VHCRPWSDFDVQLRGTRNDQMPVGGRTQIAIDLPDLDACAPLETWASSRETGPTQVGSGY
jgi:hypothetical protein